MAKLAFLLNLVHFIYSKIPDYTLMKRNETLTFQLSTSNSSLYVYLLMKKIMKLMRAK